MSEHVNVKSVEALHAFNASLLYFGHEADEALAAAADEVHRAVADVESAVFVAARHFDFCHAAVAAADAALRAAQIAALLADGGGDCRWEDGQLRDARDQLVFAEHRLIELQNTQARLAEAVNQYAVQAHHLIRAVREEVPRAVQFLTEKLIVLEIYKSIAPPTAQPAPPRPRS